jgi:hypothetical protein
MSDGIDFDFSELMRLTVDLGDVPETVAPNVRKAVQVTAMNVKRDWRAASNRTGLGGYAADITYETKETVHSIEGEIGPTVGDSGSFGLVEDANGGVRSAPQHAGRDAARKNEADFIRGILLAAEDIL